VWAQAVRATPLPKSYIRFQEELARTVDQPLQQMEVFGPQLAKAIDEALRAPEGSLARSIPMQCRGRTALGILIGAVSEKRIGLGIPCSAA
jgi:hypothetical protein